MLVVKALAQTDPPHDLRGARRLELTLDPDGEQRVARFAPGERALTSARSKDSRVDVRRVELHRRKGVD